MTKERLAELNKLLLSNNLEPEKYKDLTLDETYAVFRLATVQHAKLKEQFSKPVSKKALRDSQQHLLQLMQTKSNYFYSLSIEKLKALDAFYVATSTLTNAPFAHCDEKTFDDFVWIFTSEEKLNAVAETQKEKGEPIKSVKVENNGFLKFFSGLFFLGIDHIMIDYGTDQMVIALTHICQKPDFENLPNVAAQVNNPTLYLSTIYFLQEFRKPEELRDQENIKMLEEEMAKNLTVSQYLVPFVKPENPNEEGAQFQIPYFKGKNDHMLLPVFTDLYEFNKYNTNQQFSIAVVTFDKLPDFVKEAHAILINPLSFSLVLDKTIIEPIIKRFS